MNFGKKYRPVSYNGILHNGRLKWNTLLLLYENKKSYLLYKLLYTDFRHDQKHQYPNLKVE